jgi:DNA-binding beta-propeller fold protein YncE
MRSLSIPVLAMLVFAPLAGSAQQPRRQQDLADSDSLRALVKTVPVLDMELVELKPSVKLEGISAVTADRAGNIYVIHRPEDPNGDPVVVLDKDGKFLRSFGKGMYTIPHGIEIGPDGSVWTTDANTSKVFKFSPRGEKLLEFTVGDIPETNPGGFCSITDVAFHPQRPGHVFISDGYCNGRVVEYDEQGRKVGQFGGGRGTEPGQFNNAHGIAVGPDGYIYVADRENGRVQWFDLDGRLVGMRRYGGQFYNIAFDEQGGMWAEVHPKGVPLDQEGNVVHFDAQTGAMLGRIETRAHQLGVGPDGTVYPALRSERLVLYRPRR